MLHHPIFEKLGHLVPALDEEYFEWIDVLESASERTDAFVMAELGAGNGRWGLAGALAAATVGRPSELVFVEAEPQHCEWMAEAIATARPHLPNCYIEVFEKAVAYKRATIQFYIARAGLNAANWYGQSTSFGIPEPIDTGRLYHGKPVFRSDLLPGDEFIEVPTITIAEALARHTVVDLLDMDLQEAELDVMRFEFHVLAEKVRKVHIGTHSRAIESYLRTTFFQHEWTNVWDFAGETTNQTPYGSVYFQDGVQTWLNPKFL